MEANIPETITNGQQSTDSVNTGVLMINDLPWQKCIQCCRIVDEDEDIYSLTCFHSICSDECLDKLQNMENADGKALDCKICKRNINPDDLQMKTRLAEVFVKKPDVNDVEIVCEYCNEGNKAIAFCQDCPSLLCETCKMDHPRAKCRQLHKISLDVHDIIQKEKQDKLENLKKDRLLCNDHTQKFQFYCCQCSVKLCEHCLQSHPGHLTRKLCEDNFNLEFKAEAARQLQKACKRAKLDISKKERKIKEEINLAKRSMRHQTELMIAGLKENLKQFELNAQKDLESKQSELIMKSQSISGFETQAQILSTVAHEVVNNRDECTASIVMMKYEPFINQFTEADKLIRRNYDEFVEHNKHFYFFPGTTKYDFEKIGKLEYTSSCPQVQSSLSASPSSSVRRNEALKRSNMCQPCTSNRNLKRPRTDGTSTSSKTSRRVPKLFLKMISNEKSSSRSVNAPTDNFKRSKHPGVSLCSTSSSSASRLPTSIPIYSCELRSGNTFAGSPLSEVSTEHILSSPSPSVSTSSESLKQMEGKRSTCVAANTLDPEALGEAALNNLEEIGRHADYHDEQATSVAFGCQSTKVCAICQKKTTNPVVECPRQTCKKRFHLRCHAPILPDDIQSDRHWECYFCLTKEEIIGIRSIDTRPERSDLIPGSSQFYLACKFIMECHSIRGIEVFRRDFPEGFMTSVCKGKALLNLKYIQRKLTGLETNERSFKSVLYFMYSFRQMFVEGLAFYLRAPNFASELPIARECFTQFLSLVEHYYPQHLRIFHDVITVANKLFKK